MENKNGKPLSQCYIITTSLLCLRLYDAAATKLNLDSLCSFLSELCFHSQKELLCLFPKNNEHSSTKLRKQDSVSSDGQCLLLNNVSEVLLKSIKSGRPLIHLMKAWAVTAPCLIEAACHLERKVSKDSVQVCYWLKTN